MKPQILGRTWDLHPNSQDLWWLNLWRWLNICNSRVLFMKLPSQALLWWFPHQLLQLIQRQNRMCPIDPCFCTKEPEMGILTIIKPCDENMWQEKRVFSIDSLNDIQWHLWSYFLSLESTNLPPSFPSIAPFPINCHRLCQVSRAQPSCWWAAGHSSASFVLPGRWIGRNETTPQLLGCHGDTVTQWEVWNCWLQNSISCGSECYCSQNWQWMVTICSGSKPEMATSLFLSIKKPRPMLMLKTWNVPYQVPSSPQSSPALVALAMLEALVPLASHVLPAKQVKNCSFWMKVGCEVRLTNMWNIKIDLGILWFFLSLSIFLHCTSGSEDGLDGARDTGSCWRTELWHFLL